MILALILNKFIVGDKFSHVNYQFLILMLSPSARFLYCASLQYGFVIKILSNHHLGKWAFIDSTLMSTLLLKCFTRTKEILKVN